MTKIKLITKKNTQGYVMNTLLRRFYKDIVDVEFLNKFNLPDIHNHIGEHDAVIIVGFPFFESQRGALDTALSSMDNPFSKVYHLATFGDTYRNEGSFRSFVDEVISPVGHFVELIIDLTKFTNTGTKEDEQNVVALAKEALVFAKDIIEETDNYNRYEVTDRTISWVLLVDLLGENLYKVTEPSKELDTILKEQEVLVDALNINMQDYVLRTIGKMSANVINGTVVCFGYAEQHVNEVAHKLINFYKSHNYQKVIVFIGRHTKGDDMFSVRSYGVNAGEVAYKVHNGKGKDTTATVFLGKPSEAVNNTLLSVLSEIL